MSLPPHWADDSLSAFLDQAFRNTLATFVHKSSASGILVKIDQCYMRVGENLHHPSNVLGALLFLRSHSAFRAACRLSMSGQVADAFPSMRTCLEYALYALHIVTNPATGEKWLRRHGDTQSHKICREEFKHSNIILSLRKHDQRLYSIVEQLYNTTIDFGAHPNERAITGSMEITEKEMQQIYLHSDSLSLEYGLKMSARVGLGSLHILRLVFKERFELLGIGPKLNRLRKQL
jgi:hypothetical protein